MPRADAPQDLQAAAGTGAASVPEAAAQAAARSASESRRAPARRVLRPLGFLDPWRWLARGARDLRAAPMISLFYGLCFWLMALLLGAVFQRAPEYTLSFVSGCFLVGPFLAMGLYEVSRRAQAGLPQRAEASLACWVGHVRSMGLLVLVMLLLELLWGRASLVVFAIFFETGMPTTASVLEAVFNPRNWEFVAAYLAVGSVFAGLVFASCAVSIPMILDRDTDAISAAIGSFQAVTERPLAMFTWGALILLLVIGALMLPAAAGLLLVGPWLGHATWHAYLGCFAWEEGA